MLLTDLVIFIVIGLLMTTVLRALDGVTQLLLGLFKDLQKE
jgi:hypothetical protein